jgi:predicted outer membrane lipoprotein
MTEGAVDWQQAFNWIGGMFLAAAGWMLKALHAEIKEARQEHAALARELPSTYARRDDVRDGFSEVRDTLKRIEDKLDRKVDL